MKIIEENKTRTINKRGYVYIARYLAGQEIHIKIKPKITARMVKP
jgi:hypothetical protein